MIDADALMNRRLQSRIMGHDESQSKCFNFHYGYACAVSDVGKVIKTEPTVEAIPVAWIKAQNNSTKYYKTVQGQAVELILDLWQEAKEANGDA